jgi:peptidoglycan/LPS O-acetylase OafA/YrhL
VDAVQARDRVMVIDALRALAALMVLVSHGRREPPTGFSQMTTLDAFSRTGLGQGGVVLFFSVSGFLIAGPFLRALLHGNELPATRAYVARRAARILPAYWVALTAT